MSKIRFKKFNNKLCYVNWAEEKNANFQCFKSHIEFQVCSIHHFSFRKKIISSVSTSFDQMFNFDNYVAMPPT